MEKTPLTYLKEEYMTPSSFDVFFTPRKVLMNSQFRSAEIVDYETEDDSDNWF